MNATEFSPGESPTRGAPERGTLLEVARVFLRLGCTSFGGPIAHLGYYHGECVERRRWLTDEKFSDLVALCQFLPGPASSQVVFALGMHRAGIGGALVASACFTLPSALLMLAFAAGLSRFDQTNAGWLHGMKLAAVAVVAQAVWGMGKKLCPDRARLTLCVLAAAVLLVLPGALMQLGVIAVGGVAGYLRYRNPTEPQQPAPLLQRTRRGHLAALGALSCYFILLLVLPWIAARSSWEAVRYFDAFYRSGALVFGGGHVVLPLLRAELVPQGWLSDDQFLAGYGAAQALPGPVFAFSAYLGAVMENGDWLNGVRCLLALFLPGWLLIGGALPFWHHLRTLGWVKSSLTGANAAVVGVLLSALYNPVIAESVFVPADWAIALLAFLLLEVWKRPAWLVVVVTAAAGQFS